MRTIEKTIEVDLDDFTTQELRDELNWRGESDTDKDADTLHTVKVTRPISLEHIFKNYIQHIKLCLRSSLRKN